MSFRLKTILGIGLIQTALLLFLILMSLNFVEDAQNREIHNRAFTTANMLTSSSRDAVISNDLATLESISKEVLENPGIAYIKILDSTGHAMTMSGSETALTTTFSEDTDLQQALNDGVFDISRKIEIDGSVLGTVQLGLSTDDLLADITLIRNYSLSIAGAELLLVAFLSFMLGTWLTKHLVSLKEAAENISQGELGHQVSVTGNDEIAHTTRAFNAMSSRLQQTESQRLQTMKKLEEAEEHSRLLLTSAVEGIFGIDLNHHISFANPAVASLLDFESSDAMVGIHLTELCQNNCTQKLHIEECLAQGEVIKSDDTLLHTNNNNTLYIEFTCAPIIKNDTITGAVCILNDIIKRKEAEAAIKKVHQTALENAQAKANFMANISHEIRTPMHGVIGLLQLIQPEKLPDDYAEYISKAQESGYKLLDIIDNVLDFSKIDSGNIRQSLIDFNLDKTLSECIQHNLQQAQQKQLQLTLEKTPDTSWLKGDPQLLQKIINILIDNAIKFTNEGSVVLSAQQLDEKEDFLHLKFSIKDTGIGISRDNQRKLFESFHQVDASTTRVFGGTGLGLAITKRLVEQMGGSLHVKSQLDKGSEFIFDLKFNRSDITGDNLGAHD